MVYPWLDSAQSTGYAKLLQKDPPCETARQYLGSDIRRQTFVLWTGSISHVGLIGKEGGDGPQFFSIPAEAVVPGSLDKDKDKWKDKIIWRQIIN